MMINGLSLGAHLRMCTPYFGIVAAVWLLRLISHALDAPLDLVQLLSVTIATRVCLVLLVVQLHFRKQGGYSNVAVLSLVLNAWAQVLIILAVFLAILTGIPNIFTHPDFRIPRGSDDLLLHAYGQATFSMGFNTLIATATGCVLLALLRGVLPAEK